MHRTRRLWICSVVSLKILSRHLSLAVHFALVCVLMQKVTLAYELPLPPLDPGRKSRTPISHGVPAARRLASTAPAADQLPVEAMSSAAAGVRRDATVGRRLSGLPRAVTSRPPIAVRRAVRTRQHDLVTVRVTKPDLPVIGAAVAVRRVPVARQDNFGAQGFGSCDRRIDVIDLEQQEYAIARRHVAGVADRSVVLFHCTVGSYQLASLVTAVRFSDR